MLTEVAPHNSHSHFTDGLLEVVRILGVMMTPNPDAGYSEMSAINYQHNNNTQADDLLEEIVIRLPYIGGGGGGGPAVWGSILGSITNQTDLINYINNAIATAIAGIPDGSVDWGDIGGSVTNQTDLINYINNAITTAIAGISADKTKTIQAVICGYLQPMTGDVFFSIPCPYAGTIQTYSVSCQEAPTGSASIIQLKKNGTLITSTGASISSGANHSSTAPVFSNNTVAVNDWLTFNFSQVGSTFEGRYYTATIKIQLP